MSNEVALKENRDLIHKLFYWSYPEGNVLSKTKLASIAVFLFLFIIWTFAGTTLIYIPLSVFFAGITFLLGLAFHKMVAKPSALQIKNNDLGLVEDIKNLLFFWQDKNGNYIPSKTKIISFLVFVVMFILEVFTAKQYVLFVSIVFGLVFEIPAFMVGFAIHKLTFKDVPKKELPKRNEKPKPVQKVAEIPQKPQVIPEYLNYQIELDRLNSNFIKKEKSTRSLIEKRFEPPQLTYNRFIGGVDKSEELFKKNMDSAYTMINLASEYSPRIAGEVESKIDILKAIIQKLDDLSNELVLNEDLSKKEDIDNLISEMDDLIQSVKNYDS